MGSYFWKFRRPCSFIRIFRLMHSKVGWPDSIMDNSLSEIPLLEVITSVFLMGWVNSWRKHHSCHKFSLFETLINKQIIFLMHCPMTSLARTLENFESPSQCLRVISVPGDLWRPVRMTMVHSYWVNLLFIPFYSVRGSDIISEEPCLCLLVPCKDTISGSSGQDWGGNCL